MHPTLINAIKAAMPAQRVKFLISIRDILSVDAPRNKSGSPMLSDLDCMCATHEQQIQAASMAGIVHERVTPPAGPQGEAGEPGEEWDVAFTNANCTVHSGPFRKEDAERTCNHLNNHAEPSESVPFRIRQRPPASTRAGIDMENTVKIESIAASAYAAYAAAASASVAYAVAIAAEVYASYTKAAKTKTCPRIESEFRCPSCGGGHFGRDVITSPDGRMVVSDDAHCHDEHKTGCNWVGDYAANLHPARTKST
jgi:hypothetical protein